MTHPRHYNQGKIEVIEFIEDQKLDFHLGNTLKYICRAGRKDPSKHLEDLEKARWYLDREIEWVRATKEGRPMVRPNDMNPRTEKCPKETPGHPCRGLFSPCDMCGDWIGTYGQKSDGRHPTKEFQESLNAKLEERERWKQT